MLLWLSLIGCPAEQLGVPLPTGGGSVLKAEDLRRDTLGFLEWSVPEFFRERMEKMDVDAIAEGPGWLCARREGKGGEVRVLAARWPEDTDSAVSAAVLVSLAKAWNRPEPLTQPTWLCIVKPDATGVPEGHRYTIGPFNAGPLELGDTVRCGEPRPGVGPEELNSDWLKRQVNLIWDWFEGRAPTPEPPRRAPPPRR